MTKIDIDKLVFLEDLLWFDGPVLSLYETLDGEIALRKWVDVVENEDVWMIIETDIESVRAFIAKKISLREIELSSSKKHVVIGKVVQENAVIEDSWYATDESYFDEALT
jgi:hypothetical protein